VEHAVEYRDNSAGSTTKKSRFETAPVYYFVTVFSKLLKFYGYVTDATLDQESDVKLKLITQVLYVT